MKETASARLRRVSGGLTLGAVSGVVAGWAMQRFQAPLFRRLGRRSSIGPSKKPATVMAASRFYELVLRRSLSPDQEALAGNVAHYAMSAGTGALYTVFAEHRASKWNRQWIWQGLIFGTLVFVLADEGVNSVAGFTDPPWKYPFKVHAYAFASHLVFGVSLAAMADFLTKNPWVDEFLPDQSIDQRAWGKSAPVSSRFSEVVPEEHFREDR